MVTVQQTDGNSVHKMHWVSLKMNSVTTSKFLSEIFLSLIFIAKQFPVEFLTRCKQYPVYFRLNNSVKWGMERVKTGKQYDSYNFHFILYFDIFYHATGIWICDCFHKNKNERKKIFPCV